MVILYRKRDVWKMFSAPHIVFSPQYLQAVKWTGSSTNVHTNDHLSPSFKKSSKYHSTYVNSLMTLIRMCQIALYISVDGHYKSEYWQGELSFSRIPKCIGNVGMKSGVRLLPRCLSNPFPHISLRAHADLSTQFPSCHPR
jgi:hypothetical protein